MNFEQIQLDIINSSAKNQLVSAGAGSGKTTVMIEKIANLIIEKDVPISSLLVVTFTVLAATEMKQRLESKLKQKLADVDTDTTLNAEQIEAKKRKILSKLDEIQTASIDTIDGFNAKTIKKYFYELNINPNIEIISDTTRDFYINRAMRMAVETISKDKSKISILLDLFGGNARNLKNLEQLVIDIYNKIINLEDYVAFVQDAKKEYIINQKSELIVNNAIIQKAIDLSTILKQEIANYPQDILDKFHTNIEQLQKINKSLTLKANLMALNSIKLLSFDKKQIAQYDCLADLNQEIDEFESTVKQLENDGIDPNYDLHNEQIAEHFEYVCDLLELFMQNYDNIKAKNNLMDFNDMSRKMLELLAIDRVRADLQQRYQYIFIDEYQDVNPLQDRIMSQIASPTTQVFTVGDVKQSIYGFRGSSPEWFLQKYNNFKQNQSNGSAFDMNINYRSNPLILEFINQIFVPLMTIHTADIDYKNTAQIEPRRTDIVDEKPTILLISNEKPKLEAKGVYSVKNDVQTTPATDPKVYQAACVAEIITNLINKPFYDANLKQNRPLTYKDIAILTRVTNDESIDILINMLRQCNIPVSLNNKLQTSKSEGIKLVLSILKCVNNTADDVDYLATFMALTNLQFDDIMSIRKREQSLIADLLENQANNPQIALGFEKLNQIRLQSYVCLNNQLINYILNDMQVKNYLQSMQFGEKEVRLIEQFVSSLGVENSLSLADFVTIVEANVSRGNDYLDTDKEDSVTFETIHKSKGLEYPVVILFDAGKVFKHDSDDILFNADIGLGINYYDIATRQKSYSLPKYAIKLENSTKSYKEELRLLYVALTRAKNKLIITGTYSPSLFKSKIKKSSFLNMILSCYQSAIMAGRTDFNLCKFVFLDDVKSNTISNTEPVPEIEFLKPDFEYADKAKFNVTIKNSVTGLNTKQSEQLHFNTKAYLTPQTQYLTTEDRAQIGTHYHKALELLDLTCAYNKNTDFDDVDYKKIKLAHDVLSKIVVGAKQIHKEADFMMNMPYNQIVPNTDITDNVLVQGVLDMLVEYEDHFDIVDYKFSNLKAVVLKQKYAEQLRLYKMAVEKSFNKPVEHVYIYSINTGELV